MANLLSDAKKQQVIALGQLGWTLRRIQAATGVRRETAGAYLKAAGLVVRPPGRWGHLPKPAIEVSTDPETPGAASSGPAWAPRPQRAPTASACAPYRELIELAVAHGRNAVAIWRDLVDDHGFPAQYASVRRFVGQLRGPQPAAAHPRIVTAPGEEGQVDYGDGPMVRHPATGKYRRTRLFVFTLGYSRKSVRLLTFASSTRGWCELHEESFRRLGGTVQVVVLDNLREGVLKPDIYDPTLNPLYRDMLAHYGAVALACRVRDPDRKGKVESGVGHAKKTPLKGQRFESLEEAQAYLDHWEERWADTRIHGTTKRQVAAMFAEEKPVLLPLPIELLREHLPQVRGKHRIQDEDRPKHTPPGIQHLLLRTGRAGQQIGVVCRRMYEEEGQVAVRRIQGVLALAQKHGPAMVEDACAVALETGASNYYRFVRRYLERGPQLPLSLRQVDPLIRELTEYRDFIQSKTQENQP